MSKTGICEHCGGSFPIRDGVERLKCRVCRKNCTQSKSKSIKRFLPKRAISVLEQENVYRKYLALGGIH